LSPAEYRKSVSPSRSSVLVQVDGDQTRAPQVEIVGEEQPPGLERLRFRAHVLEGPDLLLVLGDQRHHVQVAVPVEVADRDVDGAGHGHQFVVAEPLLAVVLQVQDLAAVVAEDRRHQVGVAVLVEVAALHVGHAPQVVEQNVRGELHPAVILQPRHRADPLVGRPALAQHGDGDVQVAVLIQVDHGGVRRGGQLAVRVQDVLLP
jgi:hypothetical protein